MPDAAAAMVTRTSPFDLAGDGVILATPSMGGKPKKSPREKDLTSRYLGGGFDEDRIEQEQKFSKRSKFAVQNKLERTAAMRAAEEAFEGDASALPIGEVVQVYSLFCDVESAGQMHLCVVRKTLAKASETFIVVGDRVRFRTTGSKDEQGRPEGVIEQVLPRKSVLTRAQSFKGTRQQPIVANADQMLIVASLLFPAVKWGLIDRMLVAAQSGKLEPIVCLNKIDLAGEEGDGSVAAKLASVVLAHYRSLGIRTVQTSAETGATIEELKGLLRGKSTVLAGHSGVGKSSLIRAIQPGLDIRIGRVSDFTDKGMHTTSSARRYVLDFGAEVIDTPGVKQFGLWNVWRENLINYFPDVEAESAPAWRRQSMERILNSLPEQST